MAVDTTHPAYSAMLPIWELMHDSLLGEHAIKKKSERYLRKPSAFVAAEQLDGVDPAVARSLYDNYRHRAQYPEWCIEARRAMAGLVSKLEPDITLPPALESMRDRATEDGYSLEQLFIRGVREVLTYGRLAMLLDIDQAGAPYIALYDAFAAINWKEQTDPKTGRKRLTLAVMKEQLDVSTDEFSHETEDAYRVFRLTAGEYTAELVNQSGTVVEEATPTDIRQRALPYIPIVYCGATDTTPDPDEVPLVPMARHALKYYTVSADYYASLYYTSHPQPWIAGLTPGTDLDITVTGPSTIWELPPNASCGYLEFTGTGIEANRTDMDKQQTAAFESGARTMDVGAESGEARKARQDDQRATLSTVVSVVADSIEQLLRMAAEWVGAPTDVEHVAFRVEPDFTPAGVDPQVLAQLWQAVVAAKISTATYWDYVRTGQLPEHDYAAEQARIENPDPTDVPE